MKNISSRKKALVCSLLFLFVAMAGLTPAAAQVVVVPANGTTPTLNPVTINAGAGDQFDPHVSGDWVSYTSDFAIRYFSFTSNLDAPIPLGSSVNDLLSDVSGSKIVFSRVIVAGGTAVMVFDAATAAAPVEVDPAPAPNRFGAAIGGNTVAYIDFNLQANGELVISDLSTSNSTRITNDTLTDGNPNVSPNGNVVVWEHCVSSITNCDIYQAVRNGATWTTSVVAGTLNPEGNPDTNGTLVVYDSHRNANSDIYWRPVGGGAEFQLQLPGFEGNPSMAGNFIAFESRATIVANADLFVYDIAGNRLYQITNTQSVNEQLNDITQLPNGELRLVWSSDEDGPDQRNIRAAKFSLPSVTPSPADLLQQLIDTLATFNLPHGIANSLNAKLENAQAGLSSSACGVLNAFIHEVQAQSGKAITTQQATQLIDLANQVRAGLACS